MIAQAADAASEMRSVGVSASDISSDIEGQDAEAPEDLAADAGTEAPTGPEVAAAAQS
jgi:hypothetical protein